MNILTALLIFAGLIAILLIVRATKPTNETLLAKVKSLETEREHLRHCLNEMGDFLHICGHRKQGERVQEVLNRPTQPTGRKD